MLKKLHKKIPRTLSYSCHSLKFGSCGFKILSPLRLTKEQLNSLDRVLTRKINSLCNYTKSYKYWTLLELNKTLTKLSLESRMGKGKGPIYTEVLFLKKGSIIFEFQNIKKQVIQELFFFIKKQLGVKLILVFKK